jgi:hypothetical protein
VEDECEENFQGVGKELPKTTDLDEGKQYCQPQRYFLVLFIHYRSKTTIPPHGQTHRYQVCLLAPPESLQLLPDHILQIYPELLDDIIPIVGMPKLRKGPVISDEKDLLGIDGPPPAPFSLTLTPEMLIRSFRKGFEYQKTSKAEDRLPLEEEEREYTAKRSRARDSDSEHESEVQGSRIK